MTREDAANHALLKVNGDEGFDYVDDVRVALAAADAWDQSNGVHRLCLSEATVERAAEELWDGADPDMPWARISEYVKERTRARARAVLTSAVRGAQ